MQFIFHKAASKYVIIILGILVNTIGSAQTSHYFPFPDSNAIWTKMKIIPAESMCGKPFTGHYEIKYSLFINGDTMFLGNNYHKVYESSLQHHTYCNSGYDSVWVTPGVYYGAYRQDSLAKKIYGYDTIANAEFLLFDFNINVGDSMAGVPSYIWWHGLIVSSIDSVLVGGGYRKKYSFVGLPNDYIVEGIGWNNGSLFSEHITEPPMMAISVLFLTCFANGSNVFPDSSTQCNFVTSLNNTPNPARPVYTFYPNPSSGEFYLSASEIFFESQLLIYNCAGVCIKRMKITNNQTKVTFDCPEPGFYFYRITDRYGNIVRGKLLIE